TRRPSDLARARRAHPPVPAAGCGRGRLSGPGGCWPTAAARRWRSGRRPAPASRPGSRGCSTLAWARQAWGLRYHASPRRARKRGPANGAAQRMAIAPGMDRLIWIDLEMTGLDTDRDSILEIATVVTDAQLNVLAEGPELAISHPLQVLEAMDDW